QLAALLRVLVELYQGVPRRGRSLSFPAVRAAALGSLERALAGSRGRVRLAGPEPVLRRVRRLVEPVPELGATVHGLRATLRPYQRAGVAFLQHLRELEAGGVLADDMGLGKTLQTIAHLCVEKARRRLDKPALIVAPTSVVPNWARELARFAPHLRVVVLTGAARRERFLGIAHAEVVLTSYPLVVRDEELLLAQAFSTLVLDEAQAIKNVRSLASQALRRFDTEHRICLTGTPIENHLGELWSIVDFLSPGLLGDELSFRRCYRQPIEEARDAERVLALRDQVAPYVLRRVKHDVAPELPPKTELLCPVELEGPQRELYENIRLAAHGDVRRLIRAKGLAACTVPVLDALLKLRQVCCDPRLLSLEAARGVTASAKFDALLELLDAQLAARHRVLVFSQFTSMLDLVAEALRARGIAHLALTGATRERQRVVDAFEAGAADVFLISLKAGGTGLNLTSADSVVHYDPWWNPAAQTQATDRAYRIGQDKPVFVHRLYVAGSVEERVIHLQQKKAELAQAILGVGATALDWTEGDVEGLFAPLG
ncbi:MAG: DEAD/DEAH box helicase, partial [Polyangiaceae bacterium]|nr:DEAD/DEAH box helicase [Polyangiaceae bacterium]